MSRQDAGRGSHDRPKRALVVGRLRKGRPVADVVKDVGRTLQGERIKVRTVVVRRKRQLRRAASQAARSGVDVVVCVGGDGTVVQVATALTGTDVALAVIPTGTGNLLAGNLGIPTGRDKAARIAVTGRRRRIDVGEITVDGKRRSFTVACGIGFDASVMGRTDSEQKGRWGKLAYVANALREAGTIRNIPYELTVDGVHSTTEAAQVIVANLGRLPPGLKVRAVRPDDGHLDLLVIRATGPLSALLAGWEALRKSKPEDDRDGHATRTRAHQLHIESDPRRPVDIDGSVIGRTPIDVSIRPAALIVMVPRQ